MKTSFESRSIKTKGTLKDWNVQFTRDYENTLDLRFGHTPFDFSNVKRAVLFLNGRAEWIEKYRHLPLDLDLEANTGFVSMDHRGQGASGGLQSYIDHYDHFAMDVKKVLETTLADGVEYVFMGHSMGGLIGLYSTMRGFIRPKALILSSPLLGLPNWPIPVKYSRPFVRLLAKSQLRYVNSGGGRFERPPFELNWLTHDYEKYQEMKQSPYPIPSPTIGWVEATFTANEYVFNREHLSKLNVPVLVLGGTEERCVDSSAYQRWVDLVAKCSKAQVDFHWIQGARHELLAEAPEYYQHALKWIKGFMKQKTPHFLNE